MIKFEIRKSTTEVKYKDRWDIKKRYNYRSSRRFRGHE